MRWFVVSTSRLQVQSRLIVSWNDFLNLWSRRWLKLTRSRVRYLIPLGLWHWKILWPRLMNLRMLSLKELKLIDSPLSLTSTWKILSTSYCMDSVSIFDTKCPFQTWKVAKRVRLRGFYRYNFNGIAESLRLLTSWFINYLLIIC